MSIQYYFTMILYFQIFTLSFPFTVITNSCQEAQAWLSIFWNNHFSDIPLAIPLLEEVPWEHMANALSMEFLLATGRALCIADLNYLCKYDAFLLLNTNNIHSSKIDFSEKGLRCRCRSNKFSNIMEQIQQRPFGK